MAGIWGMLGHRGANRRSYITHQALVYLHLLPYPGLTAHRLYDSCFLDEPETVYPAAPKESSKMVVI